MASSDTNLADRSGSLVESHKSYQPRVIFFYFVIFALLATLAGGLAYQQLFNGARHRDSERVQNQRRILVPGPRGNIFDRDGRLLVGNRPRFAVVLYLDELKAEFISEARVIRRNYAEAGDKDLPTRDQFNQIARASVVQKYLGQVNQILGRDATVDRADLRKHFARQLLLPYTLIDDLDPSDYAKLLERLPVRSPLQLYASSTRFYPYGSALAHTLGYVGVESDIDAEDFPGEDLKTFKMKGTIGRDGLEKTFDGKLQGEAGGTIFRVSPAGYKINPPLEKRLPVQGRNLVTSIDIDLQRATEDAITKIAGDDMIGSAIALDVKTGEVLVMASKPDYDLTRFTPRPNHDTIADIEARQAWANRPVSSAYPPGSTFKILTSIAAMRSGAINPDEPIVDCEGTLRKFNRSFVCYNGKGHHGEVLLAEAIADSCDIYFYEAGWRASPAVLANEARRFHLDRRTGIELPNETHRMVIPDDAYKQKVRGEKWYPGDTANMAIGQGDVLVTPLEMACFAASVARNEVYTTPTLLHRADAPAQHSDPIGLTAHQRAALLDGMEGCVTHGTAAKTLALPDYQIPGVRFGGKTGTAQVPGKKNVAWFITFAPLENPEIAVAVAIEGDTPNEEYGGGRYAAPIAATILRKYFEKKNHPPAFVAPVKPS
ncbi:MAG: Peptidoglycan glycosyltransferase [Verrucomicrobia bacterium]|nr:Peptidoglycan glycosyltransferase [Verrucomicrobiota bacterium]